MRLVDVDTLGIGRCSKDILPAEYCAGWNGIVNLIEKAPTVDAVEVVRCKDCKHCRKPSEHERGYLQPEALICENTDFIDCGWNPVWPDDFCSYGKRRCEQ